MLRELVREVTGAARLEGRLVDESGHPIRGARVSLGDRIPPTTTADDGRFVFEQLAEGRYELAARVDDLHARVYARTGREAEVVMRRRRMLKVTVSDAEAPVAGATLSIEGEVFAVTDASGTARVPVGGLAQTADVTMDGYAPTSVSIGRDPELQPLDERRVVLRRGSAIRGVVLGANGTPAANATVQMHGPWRGELRTNEAGRWELAAAIAGTYQLVASSETEIAGPPVAVVHDGAVATEGVVVRTREAAAVRATVVDEDGHPSADAICFLVGGSDDGLPRVPRVWRTDDAGGGVLRGIAPDVYQLVATTNDRASAWVELALVAGQRADVTLVLEPGRAIAGTVVDARGAPVANARVQCTSLTLHADVTDEAGRFDLGGLPASPLVDGNYRISACPRHGNWTSASGACQARPGDTGLTIVLPDPTRVVGRVRFEGNPLSHFGVRGGDLGSLDTVRDPDGRFMIAIDGAKTLQIMGLGTARKLIEIADPAPGAVIDLGEIELARGHHITGHVRDASGAHVAQARVLIGRLDHFYPMTRAIELAFGNNFETTTDERGVYDFAGIGPLLRAEDRPLTITAVHPEHGAAVSAWLPPGDATVDLTLRPAGGIDGSCDASSRRSIYAIAERCDAPSDRHRTYVAAGKFRFERLPAGDYRVSVESFDHLPVAEPTTVRVEANRLVAVVLRTPT